MPFNVSRSAQFFDKEILKYPQTGLLARSVVLNAPEFTQSTTDRTVVPAGTILRLSTTLGTRYREYTAADLASGVGTIQGILTRAVDLLSAATASNEPAAVYFHEAVFATTQIVGFTLYASALVNDMRTCKFY